MTAMPALLSRPHFEVEIGAPVPFHGSGALAVLSRASAYDTHHEHYDHHDILNEEQTSQAFSDWHVVGGTHRARWASRRCRYHSDPGDQLLPSEPCDPKSWKAQEEAIPHGRLRDC